MKPKESVIRLMTRLAVEHEAVNLSQGFTDESPPFEMAWETIKAILGGDDPNMERLENCTLGQFAEQNGHSETEMLQLSLRQLMAALQSPRDRFNQYSFPFGLPELRKAISDYTNRFYGFRADADNEITVVLGATEGLSTVLNAICSRGDGIVVFQPFHEMYPSQADLFGLKPQYVTLREDHGTGRWQLDREELACTIDESTRAIILNTPHNPTGKVFTEDDLQFVADLCRERDILAITDEIYEHIVYDGHRRHFLAGLEGMKERTFVINSISKTGSATGWRIGWVLSPEAYTQRIRGIHDTMVIQAPTPLQKGAVSLLEQDDAFYGQVCDSYLKKRDILVGGLRKVGFQVSPPEGSYYLFSNYRDVDRLKGLSPMDAAMFLIKDVGVATVPGDNFYKVGDEGNDYLRFAFCRSVETLEEGVQRLTRSL